MVDDEAAAGCGFENERGVDSRRDGLARAAEEVVGRENERAAGGNTLGVESGRRGRAECPVVRLNGLGLGKC